MTADRELRARAILAKAFADGGQASCGRYIAEGNELTPDQPISLAAIRAALAEGRALGMSEAAGIAEGFEGTAAMERCDNPLVAAGQEIGDLIRQQIASTASGG